MRKRRLLAYELGSLVYSIKENSFTEPTDPVYKLLISNESFLVVFLSVRLRMCELYSGFHKLYMVAWTLQACLFLFSKTANS